MSKQIQEMISRECCADKDLFDYNGDLIEGLNGIPVFFCIHCGQLFIMGDRDGFTTPDHIFKYTKLKLTKGW